MKRPLFIGLIFLIFGILTGRYAASAIVLFFILVCFMNVFIFLLFKRFEYIVIFVLLFILGFYGIRNSLSSDILLDEYAASAHILEMDGIVMDLSETANGYLKLVVRLLRVFDGDSYYDYDIKIQAIVDMDEDIEISRFVSLRCKLEYLDVLRNPGGFDEYQYLRSRGILYKSFPEVTGKGGVEVRIENYTSIFKNRLAYVYDESLPAREAGIIKSMILGDRSGLQEDLSELYRIVGIFHVLAISGLHVSIFGMLVDALLGSLIGRRASGLATICILILYCVMTGCAVSSVRAVIMTGVVISARLLNRSSDLILSTAFGAICLLLYQPLYLWDIGFQYSFAAVFGIAFISKPIECGMEWLSEKNKALGLVLKRKYVMKFLPGTLSATIATTPVLLYHFYYFTTYAVIVNMIIVPSVFIVLVSGITVGLLGLVGLELSALMSGSVFYILYIYERIAAFFAGLPFSVILTGKPPLWICMYWYLTVFCMAYLLLRLGKSLGFSRMYFMLLCIAPLTALIFYNMRPEVLTVDMPDVGQGDCVIIIKDSARQGLAFMIDGGGNINAESVSNTGARIIAPYLDYRGVSSLDAVFVTHFDADHVRGVLEILERKKIGKLYITDISLLREIDEDTRHYYELLISTAEKYNIPVDTISAGEQLVIGMDVDNMSQGIMNQDIRFECLNPYNDMVYSDPNAASLVLRMIYKETSFMFTGDIGTASEASIMERNGDIRADVLKLAHHGSKYSNHGAFIDEVAPNAAIVGTGRGNSYGHPAETVRELLNERGIPLYNTAEHGMLRIRSDGAEITIEGFIMD